MLPAPSPPRRWGCRTVKGRGLSNDTTPHLSAFPFPGVNSMLMQAGATPSRPSPCLPTSPLTGVDGRLNRGGWDPATPHHTTCRPLCSPLQPLLGPALSKMGHALAVPHYLLYIPERGLLLRQGGSEPESQYGMLLVIRRYRSLVAFNHHRLSSPCHLLDTVTSQL
jgi:hypothetical protein